jgi:segregation and condensation protein A
MEFNVSTSVFEGPLHLLLELIESRKLFVNDVSLAAVTDDFVKQVKAGDSIPVDETSEFLVVASTLLLIKSRSLLPGLELSAEEERSIHDLEGRLKVYQAIKDAARGLEKHYGSRPRLMKNPAEVVPDFRPSKDLTVSRIRTAARAIIDALPKADKIPQAVIATIISLEEAIERLSQRINDGLRTSFKQFAGGETSKMDVIVTFLAVLELARRGRVAVLQESHGDDIVIEPAGVDVPNYGNL